MRVLVLVPLLLGLPGGTAAESVSDEFALKAAFLYRFATLVEWPADAFGEADEFSVCVVGDDPFGPRLDDAMDGRTVQGRVISIRRMAGPGVEPPCHLLYVSDSRQRELDAILSDAEGRKALTVSDIRGFIESGGMIELRRSGARLHFEIGLPAARRAGLQISSKLLRVAAAVRDPD